MYKNQNLFIIKLFHFYFSSVTFTRAIHPITATTGVTIPKGTTMLVTTRRVHGTTETPANPGVFTGGAPEVY